MKNRRGKLFGSLFKKSRISIDEFTGKFPNGTKVLTKTEQLSIKGGARIINKKLAGKTHPKTGVPFDLDGGPDFSK